MKFSAKASADFAIAPEGNHVAICNAVVDFGMQPGSGMYPDPKPQVYLRFELPTETIKYTRDGKDQEGPMAIGGTYTASMGEKANLRKLVESWFGKKFANDTAAADFDLQQLLGRKCLLNVVHKVGKQKTYANIANATPIPKGMKADYKQANESLYFSLDAPDDEAFQKLPEWMRKKIDARLEPEERELAAAGGAHQDDFNDDIPF